MDSLFAKAKDLVEAPKIAEIPFAVPPTFKPTLTTMAGHNIVHKNELNCKKSGCTGCTASNPTT